MYAADSELFPQVGIEGFKERFVEVRHRLALVEAGEEGGAIHPVERGCRPVQHLGQTEWLQVARIGDLPKQRPEYGCAEVPDGFAPAEPSGVGTAGEQRSRSGSCGVSTRPQHPSGEDAVEQGLYERRAEEPSAPVALEPDAERLLKCRAHRGKLRCAARRLDAGEAVARVRGEQPRQILRFRQRRSVRQRPCEILAKARARLAGERPGLFQPVKELIAAAGQPKGFERRGFAVCVLAHQDEVASIRHQHQPVALPVAAGLTARRREPCVVLRGLHLDHASLRGLSLARARPSAPALRRRGRSRDGPRPGRPVPERRTPSA